MYNNNYYGMAPQMAPQAGFGDMYNTGMPYVQTQAAYPQNKPALTADEINMLRKSHLNPSKLDMTVEPIEITISQCNHHDQNGVDVAVVLNDGSGMMYCPICGVTWAPVTPSDEEVKELIDMIHNIFQQMKWVGSLPTDLVREYFGMLPLIKKVPGMYKHCMANFNKYFTADPYAEAGNASVYAQFNRLTNGFAVPNPYLAGGYVQQPYVAPAQQAAPQMNYATPGYAPQGYVPAPTNTQFADQAQMMMGGTIPFEATANPMQAQMIQQPAYNMYPGQMMQQPGYAYPGQMMPQQQMMPGYAYPNQVAGVVGQVAPTTAAAPVPTADGTVKKEESLTV